MPLDRFPITYSSMPAGFPQHYVVIDGRDFLVIAYFAELAMPCRHRLAPRQSVSATIEPINAKTFNSQARVPSIGRYGSASLRQPHPAYCLQ